VLGREEPGPTAEVEARCGGRSRSHLMLVSFTALAYAFCAAVLPAGADGAVIGIGAQRLFIPKAQSI
jgi:hypothetical protein